MPLTKRELGTPWAKHSAAAVALGLLLGFAGPFGSYPAFERPVRYAFWLGLTLFGYLCALAAAAMVRATPAMARLPEPLRIGLIALFSAVPQTLAVAWVFSLIQPGRVAAPAQLPQLYAAVLAVQLVIALAASLVARAEAPAEQPAEQSEPAFLERLPAHLRRDLIALEAQDHYLKVYTSSGSTLILSRLSDAVAQLRGIDGLQVHRSWWVADASVVGVESSDGRLSIRLRNGIVAPVSRTHLQAVRARAWAKVGADFEARPHGDSNCG
jgi:hypothetical protein